MAGYPPIVQVNVSVTEAPTPSALQATGAMLSQGGTNTSPGTRTLLTQASSLTTALAGSKPVTGIVQTAGLATATTTTPHGFTVDDTLYITIAGATPAAYNGTFLCTVTTTTAFTYAVPSGTTSPATGTIVYTLEDVAELQAMVNTFFAQGGSTGVYVLELGAEGGDRDDGLDAGLCGIRRPWRGVGPGHAGAEPVCIGRRSRDRVQPRGRMARHAELCAIVQQPRHAVQLLIHFRCDPIPDRWEFGSPGDSGGG
jgi:hypothetical protein